jgi:hypothetical protein
MLDPRLVRFGLHHGAALCLAVFGATASAQTNGTVYRCTDEEGRAQYTNVRSDTNGRKCTVVTREVSVVPVPGAPRAAAPARPPSTATAAVSPGPAAATAGAASGYPRVDPSTQRARDGGRRRILEDELTTEQRSLDRAKQELGAQEGQRNGDERNYQKVLERLKPYQEAVERHERNVAALQQELGAQR